MTVFATGFVRCLTARATHASHRARILGLGLSVGIAIAALGGCSIQVPGNDGFCTRLATGERLSAKSWTDGEGGIMEWTAYDANGILLRIDRDNSREWRCASAIEARRAATAQTGSVHESAAPSGETPR